MSYQAGLISVFSVYCILILALLAVYRWGACIPNRCNLQLPSPWAAREPKNCRVRSKTSRGKDWNILIFTQGFWIVQNLLFFFDVSWILQSDAALDFSPHSDLVQCLVSFHISYPSWKDVSFQSIKCIMNQGPWWSSRPFGPWCTIWVDGGWT